MSKRIQIKCPYCGANGVLKKATEIYGNNAFEKYVYVCKNYPICNSYVGVHMGTLKPKGIMANGELRNKRIKAHKLFDAIWKNNIMTRKQAYRWLSYELCLEFEQAHIANFSNYMCDKTIEVCEKLLSNNNILEVI